MNLENGGDEEMVESHRGCGRKTRAWCGVAQEVTTEGGSMFWDKAHESRMRSPAGRCRNPRVLFIDRMKDR